jgi:urease accessory protein
MEGEVDRGSKIISDHVLTCGIFSQSHLFDLEKDMSIPTDEQVLYVVYPDESGKWRIQCVPESPDSFVSRKPLPEPWRGVRDDELSKLSGIPGCIFCHSGAFIGGNATRQGAIDMAHAALKYQ